LVPGEEAAPRCAVDPTPAPAPSPTPEPAPGPELPEPAVPGGARPAPAPSQGPPGQAPSPGLTPPMAAGVGVGSALSPPLHQPSTEVPPRESAAVANPPGSRGQVEVGAEAAPAPAPSDGAEASFAVTELESLQVSHSVVDESHGSAAVSDGTLTVEVCGARDLRPWTPQGVCRAYAMVTVTPPGLSGGAEQTGVVASTAPDWNQSFSFDIAAGRGLPDISVEVFDKDENGPDAFIGYTEVPFPHSEGPIGWKLYLAGREAKSFVLLRCRFVPRVSGFRWPVDHGERREAPARLYWSGDVSPRGTEARSQPLPTPAQASGEPTPLARGVDAQAGLDALLGRKAPTPPPPDAGPGQGGQSGAANPEAWRRWSEEPGSASKEDQMIVDELSAT